MQDNNNPPRAGLASLLEHERKAMQFKEMHVNRTASFLVDGDRVAINWVFEYTDPSGRRHRLDEVAYQLWQHGEVIKEPVA